MKKLIVLLLTSIMLLTGCKSEKCTVILNDKSIQNVVKEVEATKVKLNASFTVGDLEVIVERVTITEDSSNSGSTYTLNVDVSAINTGKGSCKMSDAIQIATFSRDLSINYANRSSEYEGGLGMGQRLLKDKMLKSGEKVFGLVPFSIKDRDTSNIKIYLLVSNKLFILHM